MVIQVLDISRPAGLQYERSQIQSHGTGIPGIFTVSGLSGKSPNANKIRYFFISDFTLGMIRLYCIRNI